MQLTILASGSGGNCALVSDGETHIIIDAGISAKRIADGILAAGMNVKNVSAVILTHEHSDHIGGLKVLCKKYSLPVYTTFGTAQVLPQAVKDEIKMLECFRAGEDFYINSVHIKSFPTVHDTPESVGYRLEANGKNICFATDLGSITKQVREAAAGADLAVLEANHDVRMLQTGPYPYYLRQRVAATHLNNDKCAELALELAQSGTERIVLAHLSRNNNAPSVAKVTVENFLRKNGVSPEIFVAPVLENLDFEV